MFICTHFLYFIFIPSLSKYSERLFEPSIDGFNVFVRLYNFPVEFANVIVIIICRFSWKLKLIEGVRMCVCVCVCLHECELINTFNLYVNFNVYWIQVMYALSNMCALHCTCVYYILFINSWIYLQWEIHSWICKCTTAYLCTRQG